MIFMHFYLVYILMLLYDDFASSFFFIIAHGNRSRKLIDLFVSLPPIQTVRYWTDKSGQFFKNDFRYLFHFYIWYILMLLYNDFAGPIFFLIAHGNRSRN
jgi:hypothetical protein